MAITKPRPTEYKGHRYDSKSEAIFARFLDLVSKRHLQSDTTIEGDYFHLNQRPDVLHLADHKWDVCEDFVSRGSKPYAGERALYEYKPKQPTETYISDLRQKTLNWSKAFSNLTGNSSIVLIRFVLVWGNPFDLAKQGGGYQYFNLADTHEDCSEFELKCKDMGSEDLIVKAIQYRFDLPHSENEMQYLANGQTYAQGVSTAI